MDEDLGNMRRAVERKEPVLWRLEPVLGRLEEEERGGGATT
jgi:hypothetical protein